MKLIGIGYLDVFCASHPDGRGWIANWIQDVKASQWKGPQEVKARYPSASFLAENVVIFNVRGNNYRLETQIAYRVGVVAIRWIGTHAEYSKRKS